MVRIPRKKCWASDKTLRGKLRGTAADPGEWAIVVWAVLAALVILAGAGVCRSQQNEPAGSEEDLRKRLDRLRSLPYTSVSEEKVSGDTMGVVLHNSDKAYQGYNLYCSRIRTEAFLADMEGRIVHRWLHPQRKGDSWEHAVMLPNGDLVVVNKTVSLIRLDWDSRLIWEKPMPVHHDVAQAEDGTFYVIWEGTQEYRDLMVRFDAVAVLNAEGQTTGVWSTYDHLKEIKRSFDPRAFLDTILDSLEAKGPLPDMAKGIPGLIEINKLGTEVMIYNYFHLNTVSLIPDNELGRKDKRFKPGNILICARNVNQIAVLDGTTMEVLWTWGEGILEWPHHPTVLATGNVLVFDNGVRRGYSKVLELDPVAGQIEWEYVADPPESFYTEQKGSAQRLPNGNTLICEGDRGRAFEVTGEGDIVWEWFNPLTRKGRRVQVYRMMRLPREEVTALLGS
jgi:hypothetical protein